MSVHIGRALEWGRRAAGLTQSQVAEHLQCNRSWIYRLEHGEHGPTHDFVECAAKLFGLPTVEAMKCGMLPLRMAMLSNFERRQVQQALVSAGVSDWEEVLTLARDGHRQPKDEVLQILAKCLSNGSVEHLLYGEGTEKQAAELETAKAG